MLDTIKKLHERGVHFVLCLAKDQGARKAKSAIEKLAGNYMPSALKARHCKHHEDGRAGSVSFRGRSGLWVLDVDHFPNEPR